MVNFHRAVLPFASCLLLNNHLASAKPLATSKQLAARAGSPYLDWAHQSVDLLNKKWYNEDKGYWNSQWWQSANAMTMLGDLATIDPSYKASAEKIYANSVIKAADGGGETKFYGDFYDDMGWWLNAWVKAYDVTGNATYLETAETIFDRILTGLNSTCGGIWWSTDRKAISAIADELYLLSAAALTNRASADKKAYYKGHALTQWNWFKDSTLINPDNIVCDGLSHTGPNPTCQSGGSSCKPTFTYTQGVILNALIELNEFDKSTDYLGLASKIANAAIKHFTQNGILVDGGVPPTADGAQFKGAFARNLMLLHQKQPEQAFVGFFKTNAESIWAKDRNVTDGQLGPIWDSFLDESITEQSHADMPGHNSAISCLLGAHVAVGT